VGISPKQFAAMTARISGGGSAKSGAGAASAPSTEVMLIQAGTIVIGIDPSLRGTGWGVVRVADPEPVHLASGTIRCPERWERTRCLGEIGKEIAGIVARFQPSECACEGLFFAQNLQTALIMGEARGAALAAVAAAGIPVHEIAPRKVKQAIVGYGAAQKIAVAKMVQRRLSLEELPGPDAADALALAIAFVQERRRPAFATAKRI
jgi:crossover junction endodeoxyribonuclease RuvC